MAARIMAVRWETAGAGVPVNVEQQEAVEREEVWRSYYADAQLAGFEHQECANYATLMTR